MPFQEEEDSIESLNKVLNQNFHEGFTLKPNGADKPNSWGQLVKSNDLIVLKIKQGYENVVQYQSQLFRLSFFANRHTYQQQHNALKWIQTHALFTRLIDNPDYQLSPIKRNYKDQCKFR